MPQAQSPTTKKDKYNNIEMLYITLDKNTIMNTIEDIEKKMIEIFSRKDNVDMHEKITSETTEDAYNISIILKEYYNVKKRNKVLVILTYKNKTKEQLEEIKNQLSKIQYITVKTNDYTDKLVLHKLKFDTDILKSKLWIGILVGVFFILILMSILIIYNVDIKK